VDAAARKADEDAEFRGCLFAGVEVALAVGGFLGMFRAKKRKRRCNAGAATAGAAAAVEATFVDIRLTAMLAAPLEV
jgi:hypothetical protein